MSKLIHLINSMSICLKTAHKIMDLNHLKFNIIQEWTPSNFLKVRVLIKKFNKMIVHNCQIPIIMSLEVARIDKGFKFLVIFQKCKKH